MDAKFHQPPDTRLPHSSTSSDFGSPKPLDPVFHTYHRAKPPPTLADLSVFAPRFQTDATYFLLLEQALAVIGSSMGLIQLIGTRDVFYVTAYNVDDLPPQMTRVEAGLVTLTADPTLVQEPYHDDMPFIRIPLMLATSCIGTLEVANPSGYMPPADVIKDLQNIASTAAMVMQNTAIESQHHHPNKRTSASRLRQHRGNSASTTSTSSMYSASSFRDTADSTTSSNVSESAECMMEALLTMSMQTATLLRDTKERMHCVV
ncbi:unnamed protein product [Aphanomyces euteiches]